MGFHAPQEMARILGESIDLSRQAQIKAVGLGAPVLAMATPPAAPDAKADPKAPATAKPAPARK